MPLWAILLVRFILVWLLFQSALTMLGLLFLPELSDPDPAWPQWPSEVYGVTLTGLAIMLALADARQARRRMRSKGAVEND